jgi:hypothetical protein
MRGAAGERRGKPESGTGFGAENSRADGSEKRIPPLEVGDDADIVFHADFVDGGDFPLLGPFLEMNGVVNVNGESEIFREPFQGRPFLLVPFDGGGQAKFEFASSKSREPVVAPGDGLALFPRLLEKIGLLADLLHGAPGFLEQAQKDFLLFRVHGMPGRAINDLSYPPPGRKRFSCRRQNGPWTG